MINVVKEIYNDLFKMYGAQGWWPLIGYKGDNPTKIESVKEYHSGNYELPNTSHQIYEVCIGAILTQNTGWIQVERALLNLKRFKAINPKTIMNMDINKLKQAIKPAGYFNQKAKKLKEFTEFYLSLKNKIPIRDELLIVWGIGKETADSMLLYAFKVPTFVVDAYTRRIFTNLGFIDEKDNYDKIKSFFEENIKPNLIVYQEYHALLVEHAKRYYAKKGQYHLCPLYKKYAKAGGKKKD